MCRHLRWLIPALLVAAAAGCGSRGADTSKWTDLDAVPRDGFAFASIRVNALWNGHSVKAIRPFLGHFENEMRSKIGLGPDDIERISVVMFEMPDVKADFNVPGKEPAGWVLVYTTKPYDQGAIRKAVAPQGSETTVSGKRFIALGGGKKGSLHFINDRLFALITGSGEQRFAQLKSPASAQGALQPAVAQAEERHFVMSFNLSEEARRKLPTEQVPLPLRGLLDVERAVFTVDDGPAVVATLQATFAQPNSATQAQKTMLDGVQMVRQQLALAKTKAAGPPQQLEPVFKMAEATLQNIKVETKGSELHAQVRVEGGSGPIAVALLLPAVQKVREAAQRTQHMNNLKMIALAMHGYHDANKRLPPAKIGKGLSWRVALLPYLEQQDLYAQFKLDEPWDSPHNKTLIDKMPKVYAANGPAPSGHTFLQVFTGPGTMFPPSGAVRFPDITDGTSNTLMVVESTSPVPWTKPDDIAFDPNQVPRLGGQFANICLAAFADGSVRALPRSLDGKTLKAAITINGGEIVNLP